MKRIIYCFILQCISITAFAQTGQIIGVVQDRNMLENLAGVTISVEGHTAVTSTDSSGKFKLSLPLGVYTITASSVGYKKMTLFNIELSAGNDKIVKFELQPEAEVLQSINVSFKRGSSAIATDMVTPLSVQQLTMEEIKSNPGANFDVSKVVQTLPGVGLNNGVGERNDVIVRGGAPNENVYYLDGVEIPILNHFQTQGSSGGAQGILNVSFIESLKLSSSAFDARYDNALASTFVIKQRDGNPERLSGNVRASLTESVLTLEGPLAKKTTFLASARQSYLSILFKIVDLPIRPDFQDYQYKVTHEFNEKTTLTAIGLGGIDRFKFAVPKESTPEKTYILRSTPYINQWNYTVGFNLNRKFQNGYMNFTLSRNMFENSVDKFEDEQKIETRRTLFVQSHEVENKFRYDINKFISGWKLSSGVAAQLVGYDGEILNKISPTKTINFNSDLSFWKYGLFTQASKNILNDRLLISAGLRTDVNTFTDNGNNPLNTLSPRLSLAYHVHKLWDINASIGTYFKIPTYTALGYKDTNGEFSNKKMDYIQSTHYVLGTQFLPKSSLRFTLEGYYKQYSMYPVSILTGISLANLGSEYGSVGSEQLQSSGGGETYGFEVYAQQKLEKNLFYVASYSFVRSKFSGLEGKLIPSSWDNEHLISATLGYKLKRNWDVGLKYRFAAGSPYTPFDLQRSQSNYLLTGSGTQNYSLLNSKRLAAYNQVDLRVDKKINFRKTALNLYLDLQNLLMQQNASAPSYTFKRTDDGMAFATTDGKVINADGSNAIPIILDDKIGHILPSIGLAFEF